jgi:hypothetical protein
MYTVARSFAWEFVGRYRLGTALALAYLLVLVVLAQVCQAEMLDPLIVVQLTTPLALVVPLLIGIFSHGDDGDVLARDSAYPRRSFTLPLRTWALVAGPLLLGSTLLVLFWLIVAGLVLQPVGVPAPLLGVAVFLVALLAWVQALTWSPFSLPFLRLLVAVPTLGALVCGAVLGLQFQVAPALLLGTSVILVPIGYVLAVAGVSRARRGDVAVRSWPALWRTGSDAGPSFTCAADSMFWLEWRHGGFAQPLFIGLVLLPELLLLALARNEQQANFQAGVFLVSLFTFLPMMAATAGVNLGNYHPWMRGVHPVPAFVAARPITTAALFAIKLRVANRATLITWSVGYLAMLALLPFAQIGPVLARWARWLIETQGTGGVVLLVLLVLALPALTWKATVNQLWVGLSGRSWIYVTLSVGLPSVFTFVSVLTILLVPDWKNPEWWRVSLPRTAIPWAVFAALALKLGAGGFIVRGLLRRRLVARRVVALFALAWAAAAGVLFALTFWLLPPEVDDRLEIACLAVVLLLPLVRFSLAPLALDWNRHR